MERHKSSIDLANVFIENRDIFHKTCINKYDQQKLERKRKQTNLQQESDSKSPQRMTRRSLSAHNFTKSCYICEGHDGGDQHECQTLQVDRHVRKIANELGDKKLLAKLSEGDMVAAEAMYHSKCLVQLYNRCRSHTHFKTGAESDRDRIKGIALPEVVSFIENSIELSEEGVSPVFHLNELLKLHKQELTQQGLVDDYVHDTRFKVKNLELIPCLTESKAGKFVLLTLKEDIVRALFEACRSSDEEEGMTLVRAASRIRRTLLINDEVFDGDLSEERQRKSVPSSLVQLVSLILDGGNLGQKKSNNLERTSTNIEQVIRFNSVRHCRCEGIDDHRHSTKNEPPLSVAIAVMIHSRTRNKSIVDKLAHEGLCVSYARVRNIRQTISYQLCKQYKKDGIVCPPSLKYGIFTFCAIDNIDHNLSSSTAKKSFHGTSISIFQHPTVEEEYISFKLESRETYDQFVRELPSNYTEIMPTRDGKSEPPPSQPSNISNQNSIAEEALPWTTKLTTNEGTLLDRISVSAFYI